MDDKKIREIIESLPEKRSRSRLEPYRQLIAELRRLRRTYREIAQVLGEEVPDSSIGRGRCTTLSAFICGENAVKVPTVYRLTDGLFELLAGMREMNSALIVVTIAI